MTNNLTLLYVEEDQKIREDFTKIFKKYFSHVIVSDNEFDALKLYHSNTIDLAILDISIPEMNGLHLAQEIRKLDKKIEIIILTAYSQKDNLIDAINSQIFAYLIKPVKQEDLDKSLKNVISKIENKTLMVLSEDYAYDLKSQSLFYKTQKINISKNEKKLISYLCENNFSHKSACDISRNIFENTDSKDDLCNNVVQLISRFKKKIFDLSGNKTFFIDNIYGLGYKITF
ncbi:MAG: response regulator transcription factor [Helicobacteraceae bacterium]|nr:response regulator transcription factor [Candidatus Sulfurimonas ponti]MBL6973647.1 response regulator transcription factor [Sulfurimonas sp.]